MSPDNAQVENGDEGWVPLQSGRWRGWPLRVAIIGHPEQSQVDHHEMWPSMTTVYHETLVHLSLSSNVTCFIPSL